MALPLAAILNIASGVLMAGLGVTLLATDPRRDWNRVFALFATFWGAQIVSANLVRVLSTPQAARIAGEVSLAFLLPLSFFLVMFAAIFPRPRAPFGTSGLAMAALLVPAAAALALLFFARSTMLVGVEPVASGGFTMMWGPAIPYLAALPFYAAFSYALLVMTRRLGEATSPIERKQVAVVLAALGLFVAYNVPFQLLTFGAAALGLVASSTAGLAEARVIAIVMLASVVVLVHLVRTLRARREGPAAREARRVLGALLGAAAAGTLVALVVLAGGPRLEVLGLVRILSVGLIVYAVARWQLFDLDLKVKHAAPVVAALAVAAATFLALDEAVSFGVAATLGGVAFLGVLLVGLRLADRVAPSISPQGDHLYLRKLDVYRASVEGIVREGRAPSEDDAWLAQQRARLGLTPRDHQVVVSLASAGADARERAPDLRPGSVVFGKYVIDSVIAEGGYGRVFLARDKALGRSVVIKELLARWRADPRVVQTFLREARIAGELDHPNIVRVYAVETHGQDHYIVMEHLPGGTLAARMGEGPLPQGEAIRVARSLLEALSAAHAKGIVHRDIKPANVLIGARGEVKLADFGIAQIATDDPQRTISGLTTGSHHPGTLQSMSPEQARGLPLDARSDLYAVGALLYRMLTGRPHVDVAGLDEFTARQAIVQAGPPAPTGTPLDPVLARLLAPDPAGRYPRAEDALHAIPLNLPVESRS